MRLFVQDYGTITFENLALSSTIKIGDQIGTFGFKDDLYGQCWTLAKASDAMWRIYSMGTDGIRIRSTVGKLIDSLSSCNEAPRTSCFIGKVRYLTDCELNDFAATHFSEGLGADGRKIASSLLIKRKAFRHEREVRLIHLSSSRTKPSQHFHFYHFDPDALVEQVMLHPQLSRAEANRLKTVIRSKMNWSGELKQSMMYRPPKGFQFVVGE